MTIVRKPAVAGIFYPDDPHELSGQLDALLAANPQPPLAASMIVAPHAGYIYSGGVAASAYNLLCDQRQRIKHVVLLGPSHRVAFSGIALPSSVRFLTPLGLVNVGAELREKICALPGVLELDTAHSLEHSLEVQLPFLQKTLGDFDCLPLVVGDADYRAVQAVIEALWQPRDTLFVISSDLSHYHSYLQARELDAQTSRDIAHLRHDIAGNQACGCRPLNGALAFASAHHMQVSVIDMKNSGDTAGDKQRVVGYGAFAIH